MLDGPLFVGEDYILHAARSPRSRRADGRNPTEGSGTRIFDASGKRSQLAEMLLNHATLKDSYAGYQTQSA